MFRIWAPWVWGTTTKALYKSTSFPLQISMPHENKLNYRNSAVGSWQTDKFSAKNKYIKTVVSFEYMHKHMAFCDIFSRSSCVGWLTFDLLSPSVIQLAILSGQINTFHMLFYTWRNWSRSPITIYMITKNIGVKRWYSWNCAIVLMRTVQAMYWQSTSLKIKRRLHYSTDPSPIYWQSFCRFSAICLELIANWHSWL